jgi:hypothetical protein
MHVGKPCMSVHPFALSSPKITPRNSVVIEKQLLTQPDKKVFNFCCNPTIQYRVHNCRKWNLIFSQMTSVNIHPLILSFQFILKISCHLRQGSPSGLFHSGFRTKIISAYLIPHMRATEPAHSIPHNLTTEVISDKE